VPPQTATVAQQSQYNEIGRDCERPQVEVWEIPADRVYLTLVNRNALSIRELADGRDIQNNSAWLDDASQSSVKQHMVIDINR
jgi:hypothetical protein